MLRVISAILGLLVFFLVIIFILENTAALGAVVPIHYNILLYRVETIQLPVWVLLLFMFAAGIIMTFFIELIGWFKTRSKIVVHKRNIRSLEKELHEYRQGRGYADDLSSGAARGAKHEISSDE